MNVAKCANAHDAYLECTNYALVQLNLPNVSMYLDAGIASSPGSFGDISVPEDMLT